MPATIESPHTAVVRPPVPKAEYCSWGRNPRVQHRAVYKVNWADEIPGILEQLGPLTCLPHGLGRSYGDSCLNEGGALLDCSGLNRILAFDRQNGRLWCEAGVSLGDILEIAIPAGWFLPVTPGTKFVTVAGAIANDVHGKNHHRAGTFGNYVTRLNLFRTDWGEVTCSTQENPDMFSATVGGMGLTGIILSAEVQLKPVSGSMIAVESLPFHSLEEFSAISNESDGSHEYTVAWIDCFSGEKPRGIFYRGNHATTPGKARHTSFTPRVPFAFPEWVLNHFTVQAFNSVYYRWNSLKRGESTMHYDPFFYPLDSVLRWNLIYGKSGFVQHQCVVPDSAGSAIEQMLRVCKKSGLGSFLAILKRFGERRSPGLLSFPRPGFTLALDFPVRREKTLRLLESLDQIVLEAGGALYPAKDARMSPQMFESSFPNWREFRRFIDPMFSSSFWRRVSRE
ncbi:MAG TPA: FAD-binding oxidoreductase [Terriglobales bacterium]